MLRAHLVAALRVHVQKLKRDGVRVPDELLELVAALSLSSGMVRNGQECSIVAGSGGVRESGSGTTTSAETMPLMVPAAKAIHLLGVSRSTLSRWVAAGRIEPVRIGRTVRYRVADLDEIGRREAS